MNLKTLLTATAITMSATCIHAIDNPGITLPGHSGNSFPLITDGTPATIIISDKDERGISIAAANLSEDFGRVSGKKAGIANEPGNSDKIIIAGTEKNPLIAQLIKSGRIDGKALKGKTEKYIMQTVDSPFPGVSEALVIAGSDRRGAIYGIYELSEQIGVSPWYDWADVPVKHQDNLSIADGTYTAGEPAVRYRGLFLNDEAPCLSLIHI